MTFNLSPKAVPPIAIAIAAAIAVWVITGDSESLLIILLGLIQSGGTIIAPPATGVTQDDVNSLAEIKGEHESTATTPLADTVVAQVDMRTNLRKKRS